MEENVSLGVDDSWETAGLYPHNQNGLGCVMFFIGKTNQRRSSRLSYFLAAQSAMYK
jgi:hypothetical protein